MVNKSFKKYTEDINNIDNNYNKILSKISRKKFSKKKVLNIAAVFAIIVALGFTSSGIYAKIKWNVEFNNYINRNVEYGSASIKEAIDNGYTQNVQMEYILQDGIGVKINSIMITDDHFESQISFKFDENVQVNAQTFSYGFVIYDENNNIYDLFSRMVLGTNEKRDKITPYIYEELGIKYDKNNIYKCTISDSANIAVDSVENRTITTKLSLDATEAFPKSKKLYIRIFDLGYYMANISKEEGISKVHTVENFNLSDKEWDFEIDVQDSFYNRESTILELETDIPDFNVSELKVSETGLSMRVESQTLIEMIKSGIESISDEWTNIVHNTIYISDDNGNKYYDIDMGTTSDENGVKLKFDISKDKLNKNNYYINLCKSGTTYTSRIVNK